MQVVIPVKSLSAAKTRLSSILDEGERKLLVRSMLEDMLLSLLESSEVGQIHIVSDDKQLTAVAKTFGVGAIPDTAGNLNGAVEQSLLALSASGAEEVMILHADIPLISGEVIDCAIRKYRVAQIKGKTITLAPARMDGGTNAVILSLPSELPMVFGENSYSHFASLASDLGFNLQVFQDPALSLDIDTPDDLQAFLSEVGRRKQARVATLNYLQSIAVERRLLSLLKGAGIHNINSGVKTERVSGLGNNKPSAACVSAKTLPRIG